MLFGEKVEFEKEIKLQFLPKISTVNFLPKNSLVSIHTCSKRKQYDII